MNTAAQPYPKRSKEQFYGGANPADLPLYTLAAAAKIIKMPVSTVRWWLRGRDARYRPVVKSDSRHLISFSELLELYVVRILRRDLGVKLLAIRRALDYADAAGITRVLLSEDLATFNGDILLRGLSESVAISRSGQLALHELISGAVQRINLAGANAPLLYPGFAGEQLVESKFPVSVSPLVSFGLPTIRGYAIRTSVIRARVDSGESAAEVAADYDVPPDLIKAALLFEQANH